MSVISAEILLQDLSNSSAVKVSVKSVTDW